MTDDNKNITKEIKEIEKHLPTITYQKIIQADFSKGYEEEYISVSDKTSDEALKTFKQIRVEVKK